MSLIPRKFLKYIIIAFVLALVLKSFFVDAFKIPTASMENTLLVGDYVLIDKASYEIKTPHYIPVINYWIPSYSLISLSEPDRNDVIVFKFPGYPNEFEPSENSSFVKRVIGLPGDTVQIKNENVYINGQMISQPADAILPPAPINKKGIIDDRIFPQNRNWTNDNYGPIVVPKKGMEIRLNAKNIINWEALIDREYGYKAVSVEGTVVNINHQPVRDYTIRKNYYFVMGDNREDSMDSRYWGYVADDLIIGKAFMIYWSWDSFKPVGKWYDFLKPLRLERIFKIVN
jgi:signal peptidase I